MLQRFAVYLVIDPAIKRRILEELWHGRHIVLWGCAVGLLYVWLFIAVTALVLMVLY